MVKYFAQYDSIEAFEADKANLPANCVILVGNEISIAAPNVYTIASTGNNHFSGGSGGSGEEDPIPIPTPDYNDPDNPDGPPEMWAD